MEEMMQQMMACLLAEIRASQEHLEEEMLVKKEASKEKFEVLQGTLVSRMDAYHSKREANH
jgi:hypothetical protein